MKTFPNYAGRSDVDQELTAELTSAGIEVANFEIFRKDSGEVKTSVLGHLEGWTFRRNWYYWVAQGPGIPPEYAIQLHATHGKECRVDGHAGAPDPIEYMKGFAVGSYHVDSHAGLKALADTIKKIISENGSIENYQTHVFRRNNEKYVRFLENTLKDYVNANKVLLKKTMPEQPDGRCYKCRGYGWFNGPGDNHEVKCERCNGTGRIPIPEPTGPEVEKIRDAEELEYFLGLNPEEMKSRRPELF